jgi:NIMA (never in mitosis gene a)-related kinase
VAYKEAFFEEDSSSLYLVMDYADGGDLYMKITDHKKKGTLLDENEIWSNFIQFTRGLKALHERNILHRDLKVQT